MNKSFTLLVLIAFTAISTFAFQAKTKAPADVAQALVDAFNTRDVEGILKTYHPNSIARRLPSGDVILSGHADIRKKFETTFQRNANIKVEVVQRIVDGAFVIDKEKIIVIKDGKPAESFGIVIYEVRDGLIVNEWYPRSR
ncbi:MAG TPA: nuclear transport factor 2 family protein [Blastocatellia bacterium]|nr:nuclear transport factor 2 family protein [Blastocatellia bacterium]